MENNYFKRIEINGDVKNLPKEDREYFVCRAGFKSVFDFVKGKSEMMWMKEVRWYFVPSPDVIVGPTEEEIKDACAEFFLYKPNGHNNTLVAWREAINWYRSQLKTVNLKDELVKFYSSLNRIYDVPIENVVNLVDDYLHKAEEGK